MNEDKKYQELRKEVRKIIKECVTEIMDDFRMRLDEMARVSKFNNIYDVVVFTDDSGYIPHVHIIDIQTRGTDFDCCIRLDTNSYFKHGKHRDIMNRKFEKEFYELMKQPHRNPRYQNVYEYAVSLWNDNNSDSYIQIKQDENGNVIVPDYSNMKD